MIKPFKFIGIAVFVLSFAIGCSHSSETKNNAVKASDTSVSNRPIPKALVDSNAKEGLNQIFYANGVLRAKGNCTNGKKVGEWQSFYQSGKLWSDEYFTNGLQDGQVTVYYESGQKKYDGQFKMGNPTGTWHYRKADGALERTADYNKKSPNTAF
jgi:antitoxin component YwqK of YwqJK toxin-antitoxin module